MKSRNTNRNYQVAFGQFLKINGLFESDIQNIEPSKLAKLIDGTWENYLGNNRTKLTKISSVRSYIETHFQIDLPKSKTRKDYSRDTLRKTNKRKLEKEEVDLLLKHFSELHESAKVTDKLPTLRNLILMKLLAGTGQRIGDLLKLTVTDAKKTVIHIKQEKTGSDISLENPCLPEILKYIAVANLGDSDFLFANGLTRKPISYQQIESVIRTESGKVFGFSITSHYFRSYVVSRLIELGHHPNDIKSVTGHADTRMIDYYNKTPGKILGLTQLLIAV